MFSKIWVCLAVVAFSSIAMARDLNEQQPVVVQATSDLLPSFQSIFDELQPGDMVVFDLDNTVFRETQFLGTDEWHAYEVQKLEHLGRHHRQAVEELDPINLEIKSKSGMRLMEPGLPGLISRLQKRGVWVIGLTSRHPRLAEATLRPLRQLGIDFADGSFPGERMVGMKLKALHNAFLWSGGVAFTDGSPKGLVLKALIERLNPSALPKRVYALDDRINHVHSFVEALLELNIEGRVIHYLKSREEGFDPELADFQLQVFRSSGKILSNREAKVRLSCRAALTARAS